MRSKLLTALWFSFMISLGFIIPDYFKGTIDRADINTPLIAFFASFITMLHRER